MIRRLLFLGLLGLLCAPNLNAQMNKLDFERFTLDNGLTVLLHENRTAPVATVSVLYHVGTKNEKPGLSGFAHFFEHLMFEGSENVGRGEFDKYLSSVGGDNNAYTSFDHTYYYEDIPSNQLALALWLESERMLHAKVDSVGIETQRAVVKEEWRTTTQNQPYGTILDEVAKRFFAETPYAITPLGKMEDIEGAQKEDFEQFYEDFYRPDNAVLSIVGDINAKEAKTLVKKYFSTIKPPSKPVYRPQFTMKILESEMRDTVYDQVQLPALIAAYPAPAQYSEDYYAMDMLNRILSAGQSSRIYKALVDEKKVAAGAGANQNALEGGGMNFMFGVANLGVGLDAVEAALNEEIERVKTDLISERELKKIKNQVENNYVYNFASNSGIAESLAIYETYLGDA
ncbi:MAG: pitrilysin family protein, partial [Bacteroidota bacterium]